MGAWIKFAVIFTFPGVSINTELPSEKSIVVSPAVTMPFEVDALREEANKVPDTNIFPDTSSISIGFSVPIPTFPSV